MLVKILNEGEDQKYKDWKIGITRNVIKEIAASLGNKEGFAVRTEWIEEVFDKNRHRS